MERWGMTVLIVEDDPMNFRVFSKILIKRGGLTVQGSEDVEEIIRLAKGGEIEVILMDVSLARSSYQGKPVDGIQITQILKSDPETASLPILLVTAHLMYSTCLMTLVALFCYNLITCVYTFKIFYNVIFESKRI